MNKISVIMLTYNREELLGKMIECILGQTFRDFEYIIVDNGSDDNSAAIADYYAKKDSRIRVIHRERGNIGSGRNSGLDVSEGEYIVFVDDDDECEPDYLEFLYDLAVKNHADVSICGATWSVNDEKRIMSPEEAVVTLLWRKNYNVAFPTKLFKRELFYRNRFLETGKYDDIYLMPKILASANKIAYHGLSKYCFNRHEGNNSAWTQNHKLLDAGTLQEYMGVYKERTAWLSEIFPKSANMWRYFNWSFLLSMADKISRFQLADCQEILIQIVDEISVNKKEIINCTYMQDYEKEYLNMEMFRSLGEKQIIFGAGLVGQRLCIHLQQAQTARILFIVDNNAALWGTKLQVNGISYDILNPVQIASVQYDKICITVRDAVKEIYTQCVTELRVPQDKIDCSFLDNFTNNIAQRYLECRNWFLEDYSNYIKKNNVVGAAAEAGVFRGAFAKEINRCFSDRKLYLYDTFEGFDERDMNQEILLSEDADSLKKWRDSMGNFSNTSSDYVLSEMPYPDNCVIKKGYFPETFAEEDETFAFVNLDCDLYAPIKAGLELFFPRLSKGGVILVHEYFDEISFLPGIKAAVDAFTNVNECTAIPIGDRESIAIIKN